MHIIIINLLCKDFTTSSLSIVQKEEEKKKKKKKKTKKKKKKTKKTFSKCIETTRDDDGFVYCAESSSFV